MMLSVASGQTLFGLADPPIVIPLAQGGKIRLLAMTGPSRLPELAEAPTAAEAGFGNIDARLQWIGAFATTGTPPAVVQSLRQRSAERSPIRPSATNSRPWPTRPTVGAARSSGN
jgi:tripartite-type tricarboxylate transporter receptor subunit TctC